MKVYTRTGDDGSTGLFHGGRVAKSAAGPSTYGTVDEAVSALGVGRAETVAGSELNDLLVRLQRELFVAGAELAANPDAWDRLVAGVTRVSEPMLAGLEEPLAELEARIEMPREFVVPGETAASAALEVARTTIRRAERRIVALERTVEIESPWVVPYVNRLADLAWVLARAAEQAEHASATPARQRT